VMKNKLGGMSRRENHRGVAVQRTGKFLKARVRSKMFPFRRKNILMSSRKLDRDQEIRKER